MATIHVTIDGKEFEFAECTGYYRSIGETEEDRRDLLYLCEECDNGETYEALYSDNLIDGEEYTLDDIVPGSTYQDDLDTIKID